MPFFLFWIYLDFDNRLKLHNVLVFYPFINLFSGVIYEITSSYLWFGELENVTSFDANAHADVEEDEERK